MKELSWYSTKPAFAVAPIRTNRFIHPYEDAKKFLRISRVFRTRGSLTRQSLFNRRRVFYSSFHFIRGSVSSVVANLIRVLAFTSDLYMVGGLS